MKELLFTLSREVFYLVLNDIVHLERINLFHRQEYCFCKDYQGPILNSEPRLCLLCQVIHFYTENELYLVRFESLKLIKFVVGFFKDLTELCLMNPLLKCKLVL